MSVKQEYDRLREAFRKRDQKKQNFLIATVIDASPRTQYGFVIARLDDNTVINVQAWSPVALEAGNKMFVAPMSNQPWNWYVLLGVNASADLEATPYTPPSNEAVALGSGVTGLLPTANQAKQTTLQTILITTPTITASSTASGSTVGVKAGFVRRISITGGATATLSLYEDSGRTVLEYATGAVSTPFSDVGGWVHLSDGNVYWLVANNGVGSASFSITLSVVAWEV